MTVQMPEMVEMKKAFDSFCLVAEELMQRLTVNNTVDIKDIARMEGTSLSQIRSGRERYLLPNFGESDYPEGKIRWTWDTYLKWKAIPVKDRQEAYHKMLKSRASNPR